MCGSGRSTASSPAGRRGPRGDGEPPRVVKSEEPASGTAGAVRLRGRRQPAVAALVPISTPEAAEVALATLEPAKSAYTMVAVARDEAAATAVVALKVKKQGHHTSMHCSISHLLLPVLLVLLSSGEFAGVEIAPASSADNVLEDIERESSERDNESNCVFH